jgi:hypothetical protein
MIFDFGRDHQAWPSLLDAECLAGDSIISIASRATFIDAPG